MVQMTSILESVVRGHQIYKLDVGYRRRLMVVLSTIDNNKLIAYLSRDQCSINQLIVA